MNRNNLIEGGLICYSIFVGVFGTLAINHIPGNQFFLGGISGALIGSSFGPILYKLTTGGHS